VIAAVLLGIGLGGFIDGIVLHQVLQWHHLVSTPIPPDTVPNLEHNTFWDGVFHLGTWAVTVAGVFVLASSDGARSDPGGARRVVGGMLAGWGGFNLVEGLVDHHILGLHHVRPGPDQLVYDLGFLLIGAVLLAAGVTLVRSATSRGRAAVM
jgi:uncharacterized membrane protein